MGIMVLFFDTYATIEMLENNKNYAIFKEERGVMFQFNLIEVYYHYFVNDGEATAKKVYSYIKSAVIAIPDDIIFEAVKFKKANSKKNLSYVDCLGYVYAKRNNIKFLTGDKEFKGMNNVEFVK
jgi:hypothetical protein